MSFSQTLEKFLNRQLVNPTGSVTLKISLNDRPFVEHRVHNIGNIKVSVSNNALIGSVFEPGVIPASIREYPRGTGHIYPIPFFSIGAIVGRDTLVTSVLEMWPGTEEAQEISGEKLSVLSIDDPLQRDSLQAKSQQDISFVYYDTLVDPQFTPFDNFLRRPHIPLPVRIKQTSYAWSFPHAENFVLFDYQITNIGLKTLKDVFIGIGFGGVVSGGEGGRGADEFDDEQLGFRRRAPAFNLRELECDFFDMLDFVWVADNDGDPNPFTGEFDQFSPTGVMSIRILSPVTPDMKVSFNWSSSDFDHTFDFSPRKAETIGRPFRDLSGDVHSPLGDHNIYYIMSSGEIDYDLALTALDHSQEGWVPAPTSAPDIADGASVGSQLSVGPFELRPGETLPFTFAYVGAENFHTNPNNMQNWDPYNPQAYLDNLDFSELIENATWAGWVYDNPGFDTNGDGFRGNFRVCKSDKVIVDTTLLIDTLVTPPETTLALETLQIITQADTVFFTGDGVPDFRAAAPPPAPVVRIAPSVGRLILDWNGLESETTPDIFTGEIDFEGYRVYLGLTNRRSDLLLASSYDIEDYTQFFFNPVKGPFVNPGLWEVIRIPFSLREAQIAYGGGRTNYDPLINTIDNPLRVNDSIFYFVKQDWNQSDLTDTSAIHKVYPAEPYPHTLDRGKAFTEDTWYEDTLSGQMTFYEAGELTPDGEYFKFFEYRYIFENLLPSQQYYVSVTAFDFGSPGSGLPWLETNPSKTAIQAMAQNTVSASANVTLDVIVYPNPYRVDGRYREHGFEGRGREDFPDERVREVHWANLPPVCDISVYSLDGDLVRTIEHRKNPDDPSAMHDSWDVISRNLLPVASGIYYWTVETPDGRTQIGKLVLIM